MRHVQFYRSPSTACVGDRAWEGHLRLWKEFGLKWMYSTFRSKTRDSKPSVTTCLPDMNLDMKQKNSSQPGYIATCCSSFRYNPYGASVYGFLFAVVFPLCHCALTNVPPRVVVWITISSPWNPTRLTYKSYRKRSGMLWCGVCQRQTWCTISWSWTDHCPCSFIFLILPPEQNTPVCTYHWLCTTGNL